MTTPTTHPQLTTKQLKWLLSGIHHGRVGKDGKGFAHVEAWDIRRHLIRCFGFGGFSTDLLSAELVTEREAPAQGAGRPRFTVVYRCAVRLTVKVQGVELGHWHGIATGDAANQPSLADAHDLALKTADSQALKRAAVNLGDQFGLSLYSNGSLKPVVLSTLAHVTDTPLPATDPPVHLEPQPAGQPETQPETGEPDDARPTARETEYAAMIQAAEKANFAEGLPVQFETYFGHPIGKGTADEYRQARELLETA